MVQGGAQMSTDKRGRGEKGKGEIGNMGSGSRDLVLFIDPPLCSLGVDCLLNVYSSQRHRGH